MIVDEVGEKRAASEEEMKQFEIDHPEIAKYW
jgi:hypothetical protein